MLKELGYTKNKTNQDCNNFRSDFSITSSSIGITAASILKLYIMLALNMSSSQRGATLNVA